MKMFAKLLILVALVGASLAAQDGIRSLSGNDEIDSRILQTQTIRPAIQLGPRPYYLIDQMTNGTLKTKLQTCENGPFSKSRLTIGHRGGGDLQFPEHSAASHRAGFRMGVDITECDVTFTSDGTLVCRHDQCDLHTTTNILVTNLASKCTKPFVPATFNAAGVVVTRASALCCTSDLTVNEFLSLKAKMDSSLSTATTAQQYQGGVAVWRTELYNTGATLLTLQTYLDLVKSLGGRFTPELKQRNTAANLQIESVFGTQEAYAQKLVDVIKAARINPKHVWLQSFNYSDIIYWIRNEPAFGEQAAYLDSANVPGDEPTLAQLQQYARDGVKIWAPPTWVLVTSRNGVIVPSQAALNWKISGIPTLITWTLERSGRIVEDVIPTNSYYFQTVIPALRNDGDFYNLLDVLVREVGIFGVFTDWSAAVTYYANCMGVGLNEFFPPYDTCAATYYVYNARTDSLFAALPNGGTISNPPCAVNIEASVACLAPIRGAVTIQLRSGERIVSARGETAAPYFLFGDSGEDIFSGTIAAGTYNVRAIVNGETLPSSGLTFAGTCVP